MMKVRVRDKDRIYCHECGVIIAGGEEALLIDDVTLCCSCSIEYLLAKISNLERRIEELEMQNGIAVHV